MEEVSILLKYSGVWIDQNVYETNFIKGIVVHPNISFNLLKKEIARQLGIDLKRKNLVLRYVVEGNKVPMQIHNDMGVKLFISLVKNILEFPNYPLCVDCFDYKIGSSNSVGEGFEAATGALDCRESVNGCRALMVIEAATTQVRPLFIISDPNHKVIRVGQTHKDKATIQSVMHSFALEHRFQFYTKRSKPKSYECICCVDDCPWYFRASRVKDTKLFKVRVFDNIHTCPLPERVFFQRQSTTKIVAAVTLPHLKNHKRKLTPNDIRTDILNTMGVQITYNKAWWAKELALKHLMVGPVDGYIQLPKYLPIVVVDGSHLNGPYMGTFISASTLDGAGNILPLAYGVVDSENVASWSWIFKQFRAAFGVRRDMAIVSDRNDSIWKSVRIGYPERTHFACM